VARARIDPPLFQDADMTTFQTSRELPASPDAVFRAIEDPQRLARWWGPNGFTNRFETFQFAPGGRWKFVMVGPDGTHYPNESEFVVVEPGRTVVLKHLCQPFFTLSIALQPGDTGTLVSWRQVFDDPAVAAAVRHIVEPANEQNLDRLAAEVTATA